MFECNLIKKKLNILGSKLESKCYITYTFYNLNYRKCLAFRNMYQDVVTSVCNRVWNMEIHFFTILCNAYWLKSLIMKHS